MNIIIVDDEQWALDCFRIESRTIPAYQNTIPFLSSRLALEYAKSHPIDFALLDIQMPGMDGLTLAQELKRLWSNIVIIFLTSHQKYLPDFIAVKADYFVMKPYDSVDLLDALHRAQRLAQPIEPTKRIQIKTFGQFDVYVDHVALAFCGKKSKELLALLVEKRGEVLYTEEAFSALYEGKPYSNENAAAYRKLLKRLEDYLVKAGVADLVLNDRGQRRLNVDIVSCDYFDFLAGDRDARDKFCGCFMSEYSWAEFTTGLLCAQKNVFPI